MLWENRLVSGRSGLRLAAAIGIPGLALYVASRAIGINTTVIPEALPPAWWTIPVLLLSALQNTLLEEVVVVGYLMNRLREPTWSVSLAVVASAPLRGSFHLYQGFGGFIGNAIMGTVFALFFIRFGSVGPLIIAHTILSWTRPPSLETPFCETIWDFLDSEKHPPPPCSGPIETPAV